MKISQIKLAEPFKNLFPITKTVLDAISYSIENSGYDGAKPVIVWQETGVLLDGHTRIEACRINGIEDVPAVTKSFGTEEEAFDYAVRCQRDRRNLTDADILRLVQVVDSRKKTGPNNCATSVAKLPDRSSTDTAEKIGTNRGKVESARRVLAQADEETKQKVFSGEKSINAAAKETAEKKKAAAEAEPKKISVFNQTNDNIEWAKWSWNPVTGCLHDCDYCYARDIANRFNGEFEPKFHEERLNAPENTKAPSTAERAWKNVFVCSMADLFGHWVPQEWIDKVIGKARSNPQWNFLFLTKNPGRMVDIDWPKNAWIGTTVDNQSRVSRAQEAFAKINATVKFLSCEPLLGPVMFDDLSMFDWVIIGARSKNTKGAEFQPEWEWVESLLGQSRDAGCKVYFKPNLKSRPQEMPE